MKPAGHSVKRYLALARVSSREQQREGFSLDVQDQALHRFAQQHRGTIVKFWKIAETASKNDERKAFKELIAYARQNAHAIDGILFFKVDRAARNLFDYVELEKLEAEHGVPAIYVSQPTDNNPAGRMMRRTLANMAAFYTEQQSIDVREGQARRVEAGLFPCKASYGYVNVRKDGRGLVEIHPVNGPKIRRIFELYGWKNHTLDSLHEQLKKEGVPYTDSSPDFPRSTLHAIPRDRAYIGEVKYRGHWYPGVHPPLVDRPTFDRAQVRMRASVYQNHDLVFGSELITCRNCGRPVTGEVKIRPTKAGPKAYTYYRCSKYTAPGHPRVRVGEADLDEQVLALFGRMRIPDDKLRDWFLAILRDALTRRKSATRAGCWN